MTKKSVKETIYAAGMEIGIYTEDFQNDYISITDMARYKSDDPTAVISNGMRNRNTLEFLGLWESLHNQSFKPLEFEGFRNQAGLNSFTLSPKKWIESVDALGIVSKSGRYGGTYAHSDIAFEFASWISVEFKSIVIDYVLDGLIKTRNDAGDYYNEMCAAIISRYIDYYGRKPDSTIYIKEARLIKSLLGLNIKDRNLMTEKELNNITQMQKLNSLLITKGVGLDARIRQLELQSQLLKM